MSNKFLDKNTHLKIINILTIIIFYLASKSNLIYTQKYAFKYCLVAAFVFCFFTSIYISKKITNAYALFLISMFVFNVGGVFLDIIGYKDATQIIWFANYKVSSIVMNKAIVTIILSILSFNIAYLVVYSKEKVKMYYSYEFNKSIYSICSKIFFIAYPIALFRLIYMLIFTIKNGYMALYTQGLSIPGGFITSISNDILMYSFYMIIISMPEKKKLNRYLGIYGVVILISLLIGNRGEPLSTILMIIFVLSYRRDYNINLIKLSIFAIIIIMLSNFVFNFRSRYIYEIKDGKNIILDFISDQSNSLNVLTLAINQEDYIEKGYKYLFYPIIYGEIGNIVHKSDEIIDSYTPVARGSLQHIISYLTNRDIYYSGGGLGGNYVAEIYMSGGIHNGIIISFIFALCLFSIIKSSFYNRTAMFFTIYLLPFYFIMPREYMLGFGFTIIRTILFLLLLKIIIKIKKNKIIVFK